MLATMSRLEICKVEPEILEFASNVRSVCVVRNEESTCFCSSSLQDSVGMVGVEYLEKYRQDRLLFGMLLLQIL